MWKAGNLKFLSGNKLLIEFEMNPLGGRDIFCQFKSEFISVGIFVRSLTRIAKLKVDSIREDLIKDSNSFTFPQNFEIIPFIELGEAVPL